MEQEPYVRFLILSDLHLNKGVGELKALSRLERLCAKIRSEIEVGSTLPFFVLGDIIEAGRAEGYAVAGKCLDHIRQQLQGYDVCFEIIPGNHDLDIKNSDLTAFDEFVAKYCNSAAFCTRSVYAKEYGAVNFIFADSNLKRKYDQPGQLDLEAIRSHIRPNLQNVLFSHHGFTQGNGSPHDTVEDGGRVLRELEKMGIAIAIHGHTHKAEVSYIEGHIAEIGCGALSKDVSDMGVIPNQFCMGGIRDGKVIFVERWADYEDGGGGFDNCMLYPAPKKFADPADIGKVKYESPEDYSIPRTVLPHSLAGEPFWFLKGQAKPLGMVLRNQINVLLLSDAGQGKSVTLKQLAFEFSREEGYFPLLVSLRFYQGERIWKLLPEAYHDLNPSRRVLLFDGYDELSADHRIAFERQLQAHTQENPQSLVLVAARSNFCRTETDDHSATFPGFYVVDLCRLSPGDVKAYLDSQHLDVGAFFHAARLAGADDLLDTPFYLTRIAALFRKNGRLPPRAELMDRLIEHSFQNDCSKAFQRLEERYQELFYVLERLALAMQLLQDYSLNERQEYQQLFTLGERELAKNCGLLQREGEGWQFTHNNFREYLAARCLSRQSQSVVLKIISDGERIKPSWLNTLGYLTALNCGWDLLGWLAGHDPTALVKFERDRVDVSIRNALFQSLFYHYEKRFQRFRGEVCTEEQLADFAASSETLTFLLERIRHPANEIALQNAVVFLRYFPIHLFGRGQETLDCLLDCCRSYPNIGEDTCRLAIVCISLLKLHTPQITTTLMQMFGACGDSFVRLGMYEYLLETGEYNHCVSYFLEGIPYIVPRLNAQDTRIGNERIILIDALKQMSTPQSVCSVLTWFAASGHTSFYGANEVFHAQCRQAVRLYPEGGQSLYEAVFSCFPWAVNGGNHQALEDMVFFFRETGTLPDASVRAAEEYNGQEWRSSPLFQKAPEALEYVKNAYLESRLSDRSVFHALVKSFVSQAKYQECADLIWEREGVRLPELLPVRDYEGERRRAKAECFGLLFNRVGAERLFGLPLSNGAKAAPTLREVMKRAVHEDPVLLEFCHKILPYTGSKSTAARFFATVDWDSFVLTAARSLVEQDKVVPTEEQREALTRLLEETVKSGIFETGITCCEDGVTFSRLAETAIYWTLYLDFPLDDADLVRFVELPAFLFGQEFDEPKYAYLERHMPHDRLLSCVLENVQEKRVHGNVLEDHIAFCLSRHCGGILSEATELCKTTRSDSSLRSTALQYVCAWTDSDFIQEVLLPDADEDLLLMIEQSCKGLKKDALRSAMEQAFAKNRSVTLLAHLITLGSGMAVKFYAGEIKRLNRPPDRCNIIGATRAIGTIHDPEFLPLLAEMLETVLGEQFQDSNLIGLRNTLPQAFINCGSRAPEETADIVKAQCKKSEENPGSVQLCYYILEEIERRHHADTDSPKTPGEVGALLLELK